MVQNIAKNFNFSHGEKQIHIEEQKRYKPKCLRQFFNSMRAHFIFQIVIFAVKAQDSSWNRYFRGIEDAWPWRHAWQWREGELFLIVEDDAELSKHWYQHPVLISNSVDTAAMLPGTGPWSTCGPSTGSTPACPGCRWSTRGSPSPTPRTPSRTSQPWSGEAMEFHGN